MKHPWTKADLHLHSTHSFDVPDLPALRPRALFEAALDHPDPEHRLDWFALTDHDTMSGWSALMRDLPEADRKLVIPGVEHTLRDPSLGFTLHVNLYGLDPDAYADLRARTETLDELLAFCDAAGIRAQYNHPTWWERRELRRGLVDFNRVPELADRFAVLELNAARTPLQNLITASLAEEKGLALTASSDSHTGEVGKAWTEAPGDTVEAFLGSVWMGESRTCIESMSYRSLLNEAHGLIDQIVDHGQDMAGTRTASNAVQTWLETLMGRFVGSPLVRRNPAARESLRGLLKTASRPIMRTVMGMERRLEDRLADSSLGAYMRSDKHRAA